MSNRKAFTLIDFMIVIVMIGILAAIAISEIREHQESRSADQPQIQSG